MNVKYFYFSPTNNTKRVISKIAENLNATNIIEYDLTMLEKNLDEYTVNSDELAIFGVPVYSGRVPEIIITYLKRIKGMGGKAVVLATYGNANYGDALLELMDIVNEQNFKVIAGAYFIGEHSYTKKVARFRPDSEDINKATYFAKLILEKLEKNDLSSPNIPGNRPYKPRKEKYIFSPHGNDDCIYCRQCPKVCPTSAIDRNKPDIVDEEKCIHCCACIKICTFDGREINDPKILELIKFLEENFMTRKEPEFFL